MSLLKTGSELDPETFVIYNLASLYMVIFLKIPKKTTGRVTNVLQYCFAPTGSVPGMSFAIEKESFKIIC